MRLYRIRYPGVEDHELSQEWVGTKAEAEALCRDSSGDWARVEVPSTKAEMIAFLNRETA